MSPRYSFVVFTFSGPLRLLSSDIRKQITALAGNRGREGMLCFPSPLMNKLNQTETAVFKLCRFTVFPKDPLLRLYIYKPAAHGPQGSPECTAKTAIFSQNTVNFASKKK